MMNYTLVNVQLITSDFATLSNFFFANLEINSDVTLQNTSMIQLDNRHVGKKSRDSSVKKTYSSLTSFTLRCPVVRVLAEYKIHVAPNTN